MRASEFEAAASAMIGMGYSPLPIAHGEKYPGRVAADGSPQNMSGWQKWCREQPSQHTVAGWLRMIGDRETGLGVACGRGLVCIDIDFEPCMNAVMDALPVAVVSKRGAKGVSLFFKGSTDIIRTKQFRAGSGVLVDLLSASRQSVLPTSRHPSGVTYEWVSQDTLLDTSIEQLTELPDDVAERVGEVLKAFGYDPDAERHTPQPAPHERNSNPVAGERSIYRQANDDAMADFECWVPKLHLCRWRRKFGGFEAVAHWRTSGSGRPLEQRGRKLSIDRRGIVDFGTGDTYTPIDLVIKARDCDKNAALNWLLEQLPQEPLILLRK